MGRLHEWEVHALPKEVKKKKLSVGNKTEAYC
jgi:hypothetical protein